MTSPRRLLVPFLIVFALALSACTPGETPPPTSTPTLTMDDPETDVGGVEAGAELNDEQRAFEEAKAAFEAYAMLHNDLDPADEDSVSALLTVLKSPYRDRYAASIAEMRAAGVTPRGKAILYNVRLNDLNLKEGKVLLDACWDVSGYGLHDEQGKLIDPISSRRVLALHASLQSAQGSSTWLIDSITSIEDQTSCN